LIGINVREAYGLRRKRRPPNEELNDLYSSPNNMVIKSRMRWARHVACTEERRGVQRLLVGKREGKIPLE
jgi:hypothetical protein